VVGSAQALCQPLRHQFPNSSIGDEFNPQPKPLLSPQMVCFLQANGNIGLGSEPEGLNTYSKQSLSINSDILKDNILSFAGFSTTNYALIITNLVVVYIE